MRVLLNAFWTFYALSCLTMKGAGSEIEIEIVFVAWVKSVLAPSLVGVRCVDEEVDSAP
jgi:hypothetical protein